LQHDTSIQLFFFFMRPPPRSTPLFPYTTLFRSRSSASSAAVGWPRCTSRATSNTIAPSRSRCCALSSPQCSAPSGFSERSASRRSEEHTSELQSRGHLVCRLLLEKKKASIGIGNLAASVGELARSHTEARQALRLSRRVGGQSKVTSYRSLGAVRLLLDVHSL